MAQDFGFKTEFGDMITLPSTDLLRFDFSACLLGGFLGGLSGGQLDLRGGLVVSSGLLQLLQVLPDRQKQRRNAMLGEPCCSWGWFFLWVSFEPCCFWGVLMQTCWFGGALGLLVFSK